MAKKEGATIDLNDPSLYINRELGLLEFNRRVLQEAMDESHPLLERLKFLGIFSSNMDEFFMIRVAGLKQQVAAGVVTRAADGMTPLEQIIAIREAAVPILSLQSRYLRKVMIPLLREEGIHIMNYPELNRAQVKSLRKYFERQVWPVLTPLAFDPGRPFPHISNLSLNLAVIVRDRVGIQHFARVKVPYLLPRFVPVPGTPATDGHGRRTFHFTWLEQIVTANLASLFPGMDVVEAYPFRVIRDADMEIQEDEASDLLISIQQSVSQRQFGSVVQLIVDKAMPKYIRDVLIENLRVEPFDLYETSGHVGLSGLTSLSLGIDRPDLKDPPFQPRIPDALKEVGHSESIFDAISREDIMLHHPYDSFEPVVELVRRAAHDPDVLAIKQTLYRVGSNSPVVQALLEARRNAKQVAVLVELKARFDEESNIGWAQALEKEGVHVVYGLLGLKTHCKVTLIVRREGDVLRRYVHLATGNYNSVTARIYTDIGLMTCSEDFCADASDLFNYLTGYSTQQEFRKFLTAPVNLRESFEALIEREINWQKGGEKGHLIFKCNSLTDADMIRQLYEASQAGVKVDLLVRGTCGLRPGIKGVSDNIQVKSIVGRFLEHSRIYYFRNGGKEEVYMGSADIMSRNLDRRVEVTFPVESPELLAQLVDVLNVYLADNVKARVLYADGTYEHLHSQDGGPPVNSQEFLLEHCYPFPPIGE